MQYTNKQKLERENLEWFGGDCKRFGEPNDKAFLEYLNFSERGIPIKSDFNFYAEAKRRRGITIHELWEKDFYKQEWFGWDTLLREENNSPIPRHIAEYISGEIFSGKDKEKIMSHYEKICKDVQTNAK